MCISVVLRISALVVDFCGTENLSSGFGFLLYRESQLGTKSKGTAVVYASAIPPNLLRESSLVLNAGVYTVRNMLYSTWMFS